MPKLIPQISSKQAALILAIVSVLFLSYCSYGVYRTFNPGPETTDIADYPEMRTRFQEIYPWAKHALPPEIPSSASNLSFYAYPYSVLQGRPHLELHFTLDADEAKIEFERLQSVSQDSDYANEIIFTIHKSMDRWATAVYDPKANTFWYELSSD